MLKPDWIAVDWGTSNMRAWAMSASGTVLDEMRSDRGMGSLKPAEFEQALRDAIAAWDHKGTPIIACGMVGSRQGWVEAPYVECPAALDDAAARLVRVAFGAGYQLHIVPGLRCVGSDGQVDVMRGEETQVAGVLAEQPEFDGVVCLPGTHSKWVHISASEIVSFQTAMTGEMFDLMANQSVLRHSVSSDALDQHAFDDAISETLSRPERLAQAMFGIRAEGLLHGLDSAKARGRLSGLLIGAELAATRPYWLGQNVLVGGAPALVALYARALAAQGVPVQTRDAERLTLAGLCLARQSLSEARH